MRKTAGDGTPLSWRPLMQSCRIKLSVLSLSKPFFLFSASRSLSIFERTK
uniref:Uncharacterized protein n=1 Tax=Anguilla anguilla TaxID=7936 RepID=A0A0E9XUC6_ANGAN